MRIAVVADSHLAPDAHAFNRNWQGVRDYVASLGAELSVHLGDVTVDELDPRSSAVLNPLRIPPGSPCRQEPGSATSHP